MENNIFYIEELFLKVEDFFGKGEFAEGKKVLEEILEQEPGYGRAHNHLGWLYYAKFDNFEKAKYHFGLAIKFACDYPASYLNYTYLLNYTNKHDELKKHVELSLQKEGVVKSILYTELGKSYELNGFFKEAVQAYKEAIRYSLSKDEMKVLEQNVARVKEKIGIFSKRLFFF